MKRILSLSLITLMAIPAAQAIDIKTDVSCKKLVIAISQAQNLETCRAAWQKVTESSTITAQDRTDILQQAVQMAQEQRATLQQELTNLAGETKNYSKIKWGIAQLTLGTYFAAGVGSFLAKKSHPFLYPEFLGINDPNNILGYKESVLAVFLIARTFLINPIGAPYCFYKAYHNLNQGINYKQLLQTNIANLESMISYLEELQTEAAA